MGKVIPAAWLPACSPRRVILHWTAGANYPSAEDLESYNLLIDRVGHVHRGEFGVLDQMNTTDGVYAAHTRGLNTGSIGMALCGMAGANERPFAPGRYPITAGQWNAALFAAADLCRRYNLEPVETELAMHCEVQQVFGVVQRGKWDIAVRAWKCPEAYAAMTPGEELRARVKILLRED